MQNTTLNNWSLLGILLLLLGAAIVLTQLIAITIIAIYHISPEQLNSKYQGNVYTLLQVFASILFFVTPAYAFSIIRYKSMGLSHLGFSKQINLKQIGWVLLMVISALPVCEALVALTEAIPLTPHLKTIFEKQEKNYVDEIVQLLHLQHSWQSFVCGLLVIALLPALSEELFFRGALQQFLVGWFKKPYLAIIITAFVFSAIHISYYGFLPRFALGLLLGLIFFYSKNILLNIFFHFVNNGIALSFLYAKTLAGQPIDADSLNTKIFPYHISIFAFVILALALFYFKRDSKKQIICY